ncbi:MAG TPA: tetratricopeptide repeat protein [Candidatus Dormibacteraeota bacterium]|nr:tetratricopeptide repeat protein [Candidatus Dormibacteraeota bacterium]
MLKCSKRDCIRERPLMLRDGLRGMCRRLVALSIGLCWVCLAVHAQTTALPLASSQTESQQSYSAGLGLVREGRLDAAIQTFEKGLSSAPRNVALLNVIGATYSLQGHFEEAEKYFLKSLQIDPEFFPARKNLAITYFDSGQYELAIPEFQKLADGPTDSRPVAYLFLGMLAEKHKEYGKASAFLEKSGEILYQYPQALIAFAHCLYELHQVPRADTVLSRLETFRALAASDYFSAGLLYSQHGQDERAWANFEKASKAQPELPGLAYQRAIVLNRLGRSLEALNILADLTRTKPDADSLNLLAHVAEKNGELKLAIQSLRQAAQLDPARQDNYLDFSTLCLDYENYPVALEAVDVGLEHVPNSYPLLVQRGVVLERLGRIDEAEEVLRKASQLQQDNSVALLSLAIIQTHAGRLQDARSLLSASLGKFPNNYYMHYQLGVVLVQIQGPEEISEEIERKAEQAFEETIRLKPSFADSYYQLSKLYSRKDFQKAEENLLTCLRLDPRHASAEYSLSRLYLKAGRRTEARELMARFESHQEAEKIKERERPRIEAAQK